MQRFHEAQKLESETGDMESLVQSDIFKGIYHVLDREIGNGDARRFLLEAFTWDMAFHRPEWDPGLFALPDAAMEKHYRRIFKDLAPSICLLRRLRDEFGEERAQELSARVSVPTGAPYLAKTFKPIKGVHRHRPVPSGAGQLPR